MELEGDSSLHFDPLLMTTFNISQIMSYMYILLWYLTSIFCFSPEP